MSPNAALARVDVERMDLARAERSLWTSMHLSVTSDLLGALSIPSESAFTFPAGMFGFPECRRFALLPAGRDGLFWLQSLEHSALTFLLADPFVFFDDYSVELGAGDRAELAQPGAGPEGGSAIDAADVAVLVIVTLPRTRDEPPTANLQGPVALNFASRRARQLAISDGGWGVRSPFNL